MEFQPDMTSRSKVNWSSKLEVEGVFHHQSTSYEAKTGLLYFEEIS